MVARRVVDERLLRHALELLLEAPQIPGSPDLGPVGGPEDEVPEAEILEDHAPQPLEHEIGALLQESGADPLGELLVLGMRGVQHDRNVRMGHSDALGEVDSGGRLLDPVARKLDVRDHAQDIGVEALEGALRLLPGRAEEDLRPGPHAQDLLREVGGLPDQPSRVVEELGIHDRQERRVVAQAVLDQQDDLHADRFDVVRRVLPILDRLDDRHQDARVAQPDEGALDRSQVVAGREVAHLLTVPSEHHHRRGGALGADPLRELDRVHVGELRGGDHEVEAAPLAHQAERLGAGRDRRETGGVVEIEVAELAE